MEIIEMGQRYKAVKSIVDYWTGILNRVRSPVVLAIASHESGFNPSALNDTGKDADRGNAWGIMQITADTVPGVIKELTATKNPLILTTLKKYDAKNPHSLLDPNLNVLLGIGYLNILAKAFNNDSDMVIAGYNRGRSGAEELLKRIGKTGIANLEYVQHVNAIRRQLESVT